jgi:hypothetical protein
MVTMIGQPHHACFSSTRIAASVTSIAFRRITSAASLLPGLSARQSIMQWQGDNTAAHQSPVTSRWRRTPR